MHGFFEFFWQQFISQPQAHLDNQSPKVSYQEQRKWGVLAGSFCKNVRLAWLWRSECQMHCWAQYPWYFCPPGRGTRLCRNPLCKTPLFLVPDLNPSVEHILGEVLGVLP